MFFVIISISIYIFGIYFILIFSNCNAIQSTDCHVRYFNKLSIYLLLFAKGKNPNHAMHAEPCLWKLGLESKNTFDPIPLE